ncbi:hypothetical protein M569_04571 [Genlisea aurea]|uniref:Uncharacterized protein n=1 Tax=Genlisea aurea TaxID=192259 RepID=S8CSF0_9LAMI|nr:hypothetical protein M569_04571 [Genlisea aurea]
MLKLKNGSGVSCDACNAAASSVYCRADLAYLCNSCDSRIHAAAHRHERVMICASCARAPAVFRSMDDPSSSLCSSCYFEDSSDRRHYRPPFLTLPDNTDGEIDIKDEDDEQEAASWLLLNDGNLNLDDYDSCSNFDESNNSQSNHHQDYSVPQKHCFISLGLDYEGSKTGNAYSPAALYQSSFFTSDVAKVPETSAENSGDPFSRPACVMDREARVLRYREKKKNRKFEKMIRYASRKAYAETRPRIKGRFVKRTDVHIACS